MRSLLSLVVVLAALVAVCVSNPVKNQEKDLPKLDWWQHSVFYQIYPKSFKDSNGDGIGDLNGITQNLEHLKDAGIQATWLSPIFKSPGVDADYDISDFRAIDPAFGTQQDFDNLLKKAKELGIKIILDFVPNHSSDLHEWFTKSVNREPGYEDYYIWRDSPPNNWQSVFGGPTWTFNKTRGQYYLHWFAPQQPDLNYRNPKVVEEMKNVLRYWIGRGVAGFRVDAVSWLFESKDLAENEPQDIDATIDMVYQWREVLDELSVNETKIMMTEQYGSIQEVMRYYGDGKGRQGAHFPFNFQLIADLNINSTPNDFVKTINSWLTNMPKNHTANWVLGNHDQHRVATRYGVERADGLTMLAMILPGVGVTYNGDEIAQENGFVSWEDTQDPQGLNAGKDHYLEKSRDFERTPFQWDATKNAGFSTASKTWLPVSDKYKDVNLAAQSKTGIESHYHAYQKILRLRNQPTLLYGGVTLKALNNDVLGISRTYSGYDTYIYVSNFHNTTTEVDLNTIQKLPNSVAVSINSVGAKLKEGQIVSSDKVTVAPYEAYIFVAKST